MFADPEGGLYSNRATNAVIGLDPVAPEPELRLPGYKVLHTQDFDYETTCLTLVACLTEIEVWSSQHPNHLPVMIMLEVKTQSVPEAAAADGLDLTIDLPWTVPVPITPELLDALDAEITSVFDPEQLITPDDVRGRRDAAGRRPRHGLAQRRRQPRQGDLHSEQHRGDALALHRGPTQYRGPTDVHQRHAR